MNRRKFLKALGAAAATAVVAAEIAAPLDAADAMWYPVYFSPGGPLIKWERGQPDEVVFDAEVYRLIRERRA